MLRDLVGSSLVANAPYAEQKILNTQISAGHHKVSSNKGGDAAPPNARAGSMKQKLVGGLQQNQNADYEYDENQKNSKPISSKHKMTNNISNVD